VVTEWLSAIQLASFVHGMPTARTNWKRLRDEFGRKAGALFDVLSHVGGTGPLSHPTAHRIN